MRAYLGFDTSCYTTSVALVGEEGQTIAAERRLLSVPAGGRGLRQQEMVYQHVQAMPALYHAAMAAAHGVTIAAVAASTRPRDVEGSYMPAFSVGEGHARMVADTLGVLLLETDHQRGHLEAGRIGNEGMGHNILALHLSGGTTELLAEEEGHVRLLGGTQDISAGQLVDRVGVALGLPFPAGPELEVLAQQALAQGQRPQGSLGVSLRGTTCSLSGAEAQAMRMVGAGADPAQLALEVYALLARLIARLLAEGAREASLREALLVGGVASSMLFRQMLGARMEKERITVKTYFAQPELSGDNAVGVARTAWKREREA